MTHRILTLLPLLAGLALACSSGSGSGPATELPTGDTSLDAATDLPSFADIVDVHGGPGDLRGTEDAADLPADQVPLQDTETELPADSDATPTDLPDGHVDPVDVVETTGNDAVVVDPLPTAFGTIAGSCQVLAAPLAADEEGLYMSTYSFASAEAFPADLLDAGAKARYDGENAGGSSICSEVMSIQFFVDCLGATLYKTENEVTYQEEGKKTDFIVSWGEEKVGVSVTRAYQGPYDNEFTLADAEALLEKKLSGMQLATARVSPEDAWDHAVLHVWTLHASWADSLVAVYPELPAEMRQDILVLVTVEEGVEWIVPEACFE